VKNYGVAVAVGLAEAVGVAVALVLTTVEAEEPENSRVKTPQIKAATTRPVKR